MRPIRSVASLLILTALPIAFSAPLRAQFSAPAGIPVRARPAFDAATAKTIIISGTAAIGVVGKTDGPQKLWATFGAHGWMVVLRADTQTLATIDHLPARLGFDTRQMPDGVHTLSLTLLNSETDQELASDTLTVTIDNKDADALAAAAVVSPLSISSNHGSAADFTTQPGVRAGRDANRPATPSGGMPLLPALATATNVKASVAASADPLRASANLLLRSGWRLFLGLSDGGIAWCASDTEKRGGTVVRLTTAEGTATSLVAENGTIWWTTASATALFAFHESKRRLTRYEVGGSFVDPNAPQVSPTPNSGVVGCVRRVAVLRGQPILLGDSGLARILDPGTGKLSDPFSTDAKGIFPQEAARRTDATNRATTCGYCLSTAGVGANARSLLVAIGAFSIDIDVNGDRNRLRAWQAGPDGAWHAIAESGTNVAPNVTSQLDRTPFGAVTVERDSLRLVLTDSNGQPAIPRDMFFERAPGMPVGAERVALGGSGVWWVARGIVFRFDPFAGAGEAFLPWNTPDMGAVHALTADRDGLWVATSNKGVRRIRPGSPSSADGYGGFVRVRLGDESAAPTTHRDQAIAAAIEEWQGTPYVWGGQSREGTDCSGFVGSMHRVAGVEIPRSTAEMAVSRQGKRVRDELRWGDTLVFPGHCAMYVGDGRTAETVGGSGGGSVSHGSVWSRTTVVVRRFLP